MSTQHAPTWRESRVASMFGTAALTVALIPLSIGLAGCGSDEGAVSPTAAPATSAAPSTVSTGLAIAALPADAGRLIPGHRPLVLVERSGGTGVVTLAGTASVEGVDVSFEPATLDGAATVAEAWLDIPDAAVAAGEQRFAVAITATDADDHATTVTITATLVPGTDDLAATATTVVGEFLAGLAGTVDGLPTTTDALPAGTPLAGLLGASHYAWFTDAWEIDVSWVIVPAPNDRAELVLRPRDAAHPTAAFAIASWSAGADDPGAVSVEPIEVPVDVIR